MYFLALLILCLVLGGLGKAVWFLVKLAFWAVVAYIAIYFVLGLFALAVSSWIVGGVLIAIFAIFGFTH